MPILPKQIGRTVALAALGFLGSCQSGDRKLRRPATSVQGQEYLRRAVRQSAEGLVIVPSKPAQHVFHRQRLLEVAQELRQPAARCFVERAAKTLRLDQVDGEQVYASVPSGQIKIRTRIQPSGEVAHTEVLESGFKDKEMEPCLQRAIEAKKFPIERDGMAHHVDIVYWVSLGMHSALESKDFGLHMRKEVARAALRSKRCFAGNTSPGVYRVDGLNLFGRDGSTLATRISKGELPKNVGDCLVVTFQKLRIPEAPESFVRPWFYSTQFTISQDALVTINDEEWLRLITLEEKLEREERRKALLLQQGKSSEPIAPSVGEVSADPSNAFAESSSDGFNDDPTKTPSSSDGNSAIEKSEEESNHEHRPPGKTDQNANQDPSTPGLQINLVPRRPKDPT